MNGFFSFVKKETLHILRDPRTMLIAILVPIVQTLLFGFAISVEIENIEFAVVATNRTEKVRQQVERISQNPYFTFKGYISPKQVDDILRDNTADVAVFFADDYDRQILAPANGRPAEKAIRLIFDASNPNVSTAGAGYLQSILQADQMAHSARPNIHLLYNPQMRSAYNFVPGIMGLIFILICALMTSVSIVREKETGTMEILLVSPVRPLWIIFAKMIPYFLISCINLVSILLLANFILDMPMSGSLIGIIGISLLYLMLALALGLFISTLSNKQSTALLIAAMILMLPVIMLSGMVFPIENMPNILQGLSCIIPARWYISAVRKLMIEGLPFAEVLRETAILAAMTLILITISIKKFNDKLE